MQTSDLLVPGISCQHCVANIRRAVTKLGGVESVEGDTDKKEIKVSYDPQKVTIQQIMKAMEDAGYPPETEK